MSSQAPFSSKLSTKTRIIVALSAPVFAVTAFAASGGLSATASAQPVSQVRAARMADAASVSAVNARARTLRASTVMATRHRRRWTPKQIAWNIMHWFGWKARWQFRYLNWLWTRESGWNVYATNPYSGAYGIPQAVPGWKMSACGRNWRWSARTQIRWGMRYIKRTYGSPRRAWAHEVYDGWY